MHTTARYQELRKQIAELGLRFQSAATQFPFSYYEIVESDLSVGIKGWNRWILENRTPDELKQQHWDIYPSGWAADTEGVWDWVMHWEPIHQDKSGNILESTKHCGVLHGISSTLVTAQRELESLSKTGIQILLAIRLEVRQCTSLEEFATLSTVLPDGHRGWLELVRQTAEVNRAADLKAEYRILNIADDRHSQCRAIRKAMTEKRDNTVRARDPADSQVCRVSPDIFSASANAIGIWLSGKQGEPILHLVCPGLTIPRILSPDATDEALELLHGVNPRRDQSVPTPPAKKAKRKAGRPRLDQETRDRDRRIFEACKAGNKREELSRFHNLTVEEIALCIDRQRKRCDRAKTK
jgi:hypothetical protein